MPEGGEGRGECGLFFLLGGVGEGHSPGSVHKLSAPSVLGTRMAFQKPKPVACSATPLCAPLPTVFEGERVRLRSQEDQGKNGGGDAGP